jgi:hypothetical protein
LTGRWFTGILEWNFQLDISGKIIVTGSVYALVLFAVLIIRRFIFMGKSKGVI